MTANRAVPIVSGQVDGFEKHAPGVVAERPTNLRRKVAVTVDAQEYMLADRHGNASAQAKTAGRDVGDGHLMLDALGGHQLGVMRHRNALTPRNMPGNSAH